LYHDPGMASPPPTVAVMVPASMKSFSCHESDGACFGIRCLPYHGARSTADTPAVTWCIISPNV
jgi:hypothetical protein